jgi:hypothetical protein
MSSYHFLFVVRDGKIQQVKGYLCTIHATKCSAPEVRYWRDACPGIRAGSHSMERVHRNQHHRETTKMTNGGAMYVAGGSK